MLRLPLTLCPQPLAAAELLVEELVLTLALPSAGAVASRLLNTLLHSVRLLGLTPLLLCRLIPSCCCPVLSPFFSSDHFALFWQAS